MGVTADLGRRLLAPLTRRIDGLTWRLDLIERHRAEAQQLQAQDLAEVAQEVREALASAQAAAEARHADICDTLAGLGRRLDDLERRVESAHESQVESAAYLGRNARDLLAADRGPSTGPGD